MPDSATGPTRVLLVGMMGAGKSRTGAVVASRLGWPHLDSDERVELMAGSTIAQIFATEGEAAFRGYEAQALAEALAGSGPVVVSVAGGAVLSADNRRLLEAAGFVVWLRASLAILAQRVVVGEHRPLLQGDRLARLSELYETRRPRYEELADVVIDVDELTPDQVADRVVAALHAEAGQAPVGGGRGA